jgi:hypothetical protein
VSGARFQVSGRLPPSSPWGKGWSASAFSSAGEGRAFARRRVMDAQGAQPAMARKRVRGLPACAPQFAPNNSRVRRPYHSGQDVRTTFVFLRDIMSSCFDSGARDFKIE